MNGTSKRWFSDRASRLCLLYLGFAVTACDEASHRPRDCITTSTNSLGYDEESEATGLVVSEVFGPVLGIHVYGGGYPVLRRPMESTVSLDLDRDSIREEFYSNCVPAVCADTENHLATSDGVWDLSWSSTACFDATGFLVTGTIQPPRANQGSLPESVEFEGVEYPVVELHVSSASEMLDGGEVAVLGSAIVIADVPPRLVGSIAQLFEPTLIWRTDNRLPGWAR